MQQLDMFRRADARDFTRKHKGEIYKRCEGRCQACGNRVMPGGFRYDHIIAWTVSHDSRPQNGQLLCNPCDAIKTPKDQTWIAKANRQRDAHIEARPRRRSRMRLGRADKLKRTIDGRIVERKTLSQRLVETGRITLEEK